MVSLKKENPYKNPKIRIFEKIRTKIPTSGNTDIGPIAKGTYCVCTYSSILYYF